MTEQADTAWISTPESLDALRSALDDRCSARTTTATPRP